MRQALLNHSRCHPSLIWKSLIHHAWSPFDTRGQLLRLLQKAVYQEKPAPTKNISQALATKQAQKRGRNILYSLQLRTRECVSLYCLLDHPSPLPNVFANFIKLLWCRRGKKEPLSFKARKEPFGNATCDSQRRPSVNGLLPSPNTLLITNYSRNSSLLNRSATQ